MSNTLSIPPSHCSTSDCYRHQSYFVFVYLFVVLLGTGSVTPDLPFVNWKRRFDILLTVHLNIFILILTNLMH